MKRSAFLQLLLSSPLALAAMKVNQLERLTDEFSRTEKMPVMFIGHGHPMNALYDNSFTRSLQQIGASIPRPNAVMMVSAHWETRGTYVSVNPSPKAIYDFGDFDKRLFDIRYEPHGHPQLARTVIEQLPTVLEDPRMGLDHGAWTVLKYIYPLADIPVFQLSIDYTQPPEKHFEMAQTLGKLREKGVLIIGSGNIVHNLGLVDWQNIGAKTEDWAIEFDTTVRNKLNDNNFTALIDYKKMGTSALMSIPTEDHYLPMLYTLGAASANEKVTYLYEGFQYANISMRCFKIG